MFDEDGNDVTPAPLIHPDGAGGVPKGPSKGSIAGDESQVHTCLETNQYIAQFVMAVIYGFW